MWAVEIFREIFPMINGKIKLETDVWGRRKSESKMIVLGFFFFFF